LVSFLEQHEAIDLKNLEKNPISSFRFELLPVYVLSILAKSGSAISLLSVISLDSSSIVEVN